MVDLIDEAFAELERVEAPVTWDDVLAVKATVSRSSCRRRAGIATDRSHRRRRLSVVLAAAALLIVFVAVVAVRSDVERKPSGVSATGGTTVQPVVDTDDRARDVCHAVGRSLRVDGRSVPRLERSSGHVREHSSRIAAGAGRRRRDAAGSPHRQPARHVLR